MKKQILILGIICLFIGIAIAPSVTSIEFTENKTLDNDLVEITLQLCKTSGFEDHKMFITQEQDEQLDRLIESFKADLDKAETREETIEIYKDMIISLNRLGILTEDLSWEVTQQLVIKNNYHKALFENMKNKPKFLDDNENMFCLVSGSSDSGAWVEGPVKTFIYHIANFLYKLLGYTDGVEILLLLMVLLDFINSYPVLEYGHNIIPFRAMEKIGFGGYYYDDYYNKIKFSASATVNSYGINGKIQWDGIVYGQLPVVPVLNLFRTFYTGIVGLTGIRIDYLKDGFSNYFFLGTALWVKLGSNPPY